MTHRNASRNQEKCSRVGIAGVGGYAAAHHAALLELEKEDRLRVTTTCDPRVHELGEAHQLFDFARRGVSIYSNFGEMLDSGLCDWLTIATPILFHAEMHRQSVQHSLPCYLEKPPTLDPQELEQMIACDSRAKKRTMVGFRYIYQPERLHLKERLCRGDFGELQRVCLLGAWQRTDEYYSRNDWAGNLFQKGRLLLDSCLGNAMAHHVHNLLFFAGIERANDWADCRQVEARLFRANPIEGPDTVLVRGLLSSSIEFRLALTHACQTNRRTEETLFCDNATIRIYPLSHIDITYSGGLRETIILEERPLLKENFTIFQNYISESGGEILSTLPDCRPFVTLNALAYLSAKNIVQITRSQAHHVPPTSSDPGFWVIPKIESILNRFVDSGEFPLAGLLSDEPQESSVAKPSDLPRLVPHLASYREY